ncbi:MAG TPA: hypothetical protein VN696_09585 [Pyrinomonadaceae bacterium]|nr:hypothetical protein [Pyrinomonadaceae bacterium]
MKARTIALMVSVLLMGILLGGIVYAHIVFFPPYLSALPNSAVLVNGPYALHDEYFWTLIHPPAVLSLVVALILNWKIPARRKLIAIPLIVYVLAIVVTALYFVPELRAFKASGNSALSAAEWYARGQRWQHLSWTRGTLIGLSYIALLLALVRREDDNAG